MFMCSVHMHEDMTRTELLVIRELLYHYLSDIVMNAISAQVLSDLGCHKPKICIACSEVYGAQRGCRA